MNVELLRVKGGIALHDDGFAQHLFEFIEPARVVGLERFDHLRIYAQHHVSAIEMFLHLAQFNVDFVGHRGWALDHSRGSADGAGNAQRALKRLLDALAGDGHETEIIELEHL